MWKAWKRSECRSIFYNIGPNEEVILVDHMEDGIHISQNRLSAV
jgi:hypothetical protein